MNELILCESGDYIFSTKIYKSKTIFQEYQNPLNVCTITYICIYIQQVDNVTHKLYKMLELDTLNNLRSNRA